MSVRIKFKDSTFNAENSINIKSEELKRELDFKLAKAAYKEFYSNVFSNKGIKTAFRKSIQKGLVEIKDQFKIFYKNYSLSLQINPSLKKAFKAKEAKEAKKSKEFKSFINGIKTPSLLKAKEKDNHDCRTK
ncbi:hypothetical protein QIA17_00410 (plasmid) [Borreliella californiensis]|uniref:Uncharacterized protein n=1 Tax=Borreliella californiensis TaxID=373543 RepID=A0A7W9ZKV9_9SPIR|nr:hypothetical protein [Borreliella californiensis]MBB6213396.1 hypothetical protein [Borreliella californiensis]MBB6213445.1 hypothetical protein [Borreliella californiensis]WKC91301.1 hypothetical protein QIA17_00410 [Borreliella californiensis]WNY70961.1 hypothetical protein QIA39_04655 [Borreliella californiensis]